MKCGWDGRRVGVGRVEGVFLVLQVNVDRVFASTVSAAVTSSLLRHFVFVVHFV